MEIYSLCGILSSFLVCHVTFSYAKVQHKVRCLDDVMLVDIVKPDTVAQIYLDQLKNYPDDECQAKMEGSHARLHLSLTDIHRCGVTRVYNRMTGSNMYYHRVVVEQAGTPPAKELLVVKCTVPSAQSHTNHTVTKRNVLPAGFQEPEDLEVTTTLTGKAPEPMLNVGVRQGNQQVTGELNVNPGTPLSMEIFLDKASAPIYGVLVSYMQVTDTKQQEETIIFNGCSVDPYLFENFNTVNGDFLTAKFRAFKFPDSTYVQFRGTVNVCLDKCKGIECSNGQIGYGRRRRDVSSMPADPNKLFEVSLTTFIKINFIESKTEQNRSKEPNATDSVFILKDHLYPNGVRIQEEEEIIQTKTVESSDNGVEASTGQNMREELKYAVVMETATNNAHTNSILANFVAVTLFLTVMLI